MPAHTQHKALGILECPPERTLFHVPHQAGVVEGRRAQIFSIRGPVDVGHLSAMAFQSAVGAPLFQIINSEKIENEKQTLQWALTDWLIDWLNQKTANVLKFGSFPLSVQNTKPIMNQPWKSKSKCFQLNQELKRTSLSSLNHYTETKTTLQLHRYQYTTLAIDRLIDWLIDWLTQVDLAGHPSESCNFHRWISTGKSLHRRLPRPAAIHPDWNARNWSLPHGVPGTHGILSWGQLILHCLPLDPSDKSATVAPPICLPWQYVRIFFHF